MRLTFTGTGNAAGVPAYGCHCVACARATQQPDRRRGPCSAALLVGGETTLIDAGNLQLGERFPAGSFSRVLLTHYHMDHVQGLFPIRWGITETIPVFGPADEQGCDDLFKHPGVLDFSETFAAFDQRQFSELSVTALPLNHSKLCLGYAFEYKGKKLAYLTDTAGLPEQTMHFLKRWKADVVVVDGSSPPKEIKSKNHNDLTMAIDIHRCVASNKTYLTHISHQLDEWFETTGIECPEGVVAAYDGLQIELTE